MHILVIPSFYPTESNPNLGSFFCEQAGALAKYGHHINILTHTFGSPPPEATRLGPIAGCSVMQEGPLKVYRITLRYLLPVKTALYALVTLPVYRRAYQMYCQTEGAPDVIHAQSSLYGGWIAGQIEHTRHTPVVLTEHLSGFIEGTLSPLQRRFARTALIHADRLSVVSKRLKDNITPYTGGKLVEVIPNFVDTDYFSPGDSDPIKRTTFQFALVGNLLPIKRVDLALTAFQQAFKGQNVILKIAGDGKLRESLVQMACDLGIANQVKFIGRVDKAGVRNLLRESNALISTSRTETFGITLIEATSCGLPVIATRSGGPEEIVTPECGLLVPTDDASAFADAMVKIVNNPSRYPPSQIRSLCMERYGEEAVIRQLEAFYKAGADCARRS